MTRIIGREDLVGDEGRPKNERRFELVSTPEQGEGSQAKLVELSAEERQDIELWMMGARPNIPHIELYARAMAFSQVDASDKKVFSKEDVPWIMKNVPGSMVDKLGKIALRLSGMAADSVETEKGNSSSSRPGDSCIVSPGSLEGRAAIS